LSPITDKTRVPESRSRLSLIDHIASTILCCVSWFLLISGAIFCAETLLETIASSALDWVKFLIGAAVLAVGYILRVIRRRSFRR
jgi:hypothetical protein